MMTKVDKFRLNSSFDMGISIKVGNFSILMSFNRWCGADKYTLHRWIGSRLDDIGIDSEINSDNNRVIKIVGVDEI